MKEQDVDNDRSEHGETQRDEAPDEQEQSANDLAEGDAVNVVTNEKSVEEDLGGSALGSINSDSWLRVKNPRTPHEDTVKQTGSQ